MEIKNAKPKDLEELIEVESGRYRKLSGLLGLLQRGLLIVIPILGILYISGINTYIGLGVYTEQYVGLFMTLVFVATFLSTPATKRASRIHLPWYDALLAVLALPSGLYITWNYAEIVFHLGEMTLDRTVLGALTILLILEGVRRFAGWILVGVICFFILYGRFAGYFPGTMEGISTPWERLVNYLYVDPNSILGQMTLAAGIALAFIFFGECLTAFGGANHLGNIAIAALGRFRGGSAKASVGMSSLIGMITGGAVNNAIISGKVTIPLMTKSGYSLPFAGAVEAVASSGGAIMPPVMGIIAFMIADNLGIPYAEVAIAALVPAVLFYLTLFVQVDLEAGKKGFKSIPKEDVAKASAALREGWVIIPCLAILIYTLMVLRLDPSIAGVISGFAAIPFLVMTKSGRGNILERIVASFENTGKTLMSMSALIAGAGIIVGIAAVSGLGFNIAYALTSLSHDNLFVLLLLAAVSSVILGMGMPSVPAYALVATLIAPALVKLGILPIAAHLFIFYFANVANWTPPVALACFACSAITGVNPNRIGWIAMRLGILAYIVPFLFVYSPALILRDGSSMVIFTSVATAIIGCVFLGVGLVGYLFQDVPMVRRVLFSIAGAALLIPLKGDMMVGAIINGVGLFIAVVLFLWELRIRRHNTEVLHEGHVVSGDI